MDTSTEIVPDCDEGAELRRIVSRRMTAEEWVDLLIRRGAELRAVGVLRVSADGCSAVIAPHLPELDQSDSKRLPVAELDPLEDPITFGGRVPGYDIPRSDDEEQVQ